MAAGDAADRGLGEGDLLEISTPRGPGARRGCGSAASGRRGLPAVPLRLLGHRRRGTTDDAGRAANELTITDWDPVSKQPLFKTAAAAVRKLADAVGPSAGTHDHGVRTGDRLPAADDRRRRRRGRGTRSRGGQA